jgi:triosephosphate isomerase (TIM)
MKTVNTQRQGNVMRATTNMRAGAQSTQAAKMNIGMSSNQRSAAMRVSAVSGSGFSSQIQAKGFGNFSSGPAPSASQITGERMSMNVDTSNWGVMKMSQSSFNTNELVSNMQNMANRAQQMSSIKRSQAQASCGDFSFSVSGTGMTMKDNFQDSNFGAKMAPKRRFNRGFALMALPEGAEGAWGSYNRKYVIGGNWKSNGDIDFAAKHVNDVLNKVEFDTNNVEVVIAPTDIHLTSVKDITKPEIQVSAQDVSQYGRGAYTGNVTADQLTDIGIKWTLTGHSERRSLFGETDQDVAVKTKIAIENGMNVMVCIGELLEERESGKTDEVNARQLQAVADEIAEGQWGNVVIAYEPVWAIGTGKVATPEQAEETHLNIRAWLHENISPEVAAATRILYGGSVNGGNAETLIGQPNIDGFLVGGASLKPEFGDIISAADANKKN